MSSLGDKLRERLAGFENRQAKVGWFGTAKYPDSNKPVAEVALIQEFGAPKASIPARPVIRPTIDAKREEWSEDLRKGVRAVIAGSANADQVLEMVGLKVAGQLRAAYGSGDFLPLSPTTLMLRKWRDADRSLKVNRTVVAQAAAAVARGEDYSFANSQPLHDSGYLISTLTNVVGPAETGKPIR